MTSIVGAEHEFHDEDYARGWAERFVPTPERLQLFDAIIERLRDSALPSSHVVELGIGPGYLAARLLDALPDITYEGLDFSAPMLDIAAHRLAPHARRVRFTQADLVNEDWPAKVERPVGAIVSTWALHDLGGEAQTASVYRGCRRILPPEGVFLNGDFVKPDGTRHPFEAGRFPVARHLALLRAAGFGQARCLMVLEEELEAPTAAQNYACLEAVA